MKFVHAADLHLDSPLRGLARYEGAPHKAVRGATRRALENLIDLCLDERVSFLLIAGDIYDGNWRDYNTGLFFAAQLSRLRAADIPVVLIRGNHDAASQISRHLRLPENVRELSVQAPESFDLPSLGVRLHGQGFATKAVTHDLVGGYPQATPGMFNIGLLHTSAGGREGHENYAPCRVEALIAKGYDYWALGHVHQREVLSQTPYIVFPGNLQGRHIRETGAKGATLVTVTDGQIASVEHRALDVVRWRMVAIDVSAATSQHDVIDLARAGIELALDECEGRPLAARVSLEGATPVHTSIVQSPEQYANQIRLAATDIGQEGVFVEKIEWGTRTTIDLTQVREQDDAIGQLARTLDAMKDDPQALASLLPDLADLKQRLPIELREGEKPLSFDAAYLRNLLIDVEEMLIPRLLAPEKDR